MAADHARRFLVRRHLLAPPRSLPARAASVLTVIDHLGLLQFDPLEVPGARNHDLVLHARIRGYRRGWCERWLYGRDRRLIEVYNKSLNILPMGELPHYALAWDRSRSPLPGHHPARAGGGGRRDRGPDPERRTALHRRVQGAQPCGGLVVGADLRRAGGDGGALRQRPAGDRPAGRQSALLRPDRAAGPGRAARRGASRRTMRCAIGCSAAIGPSGCWPARARRTHLQHRVGRRPHALGGRAGRGRNPPPRGSRGGATAALHPGRRTSIAGGDRLSLSPAARRHLPGAAGPPGLGSAPAARAVRLRLHLGGVRAGRQAALRLLRAAAPVRRPSSWAASSRGSIGGPATWRSRHLVRARLRADGGAALRPRARPPRCTPTARSSAPMRCLGRARGWGARWRCSVERQAAAA